MDEVSSGADNALKTRLELAAGVYATLAYMNRITSRFVTKSRFVPMVVGMLVLTMMLELFGNGPLFHHDIIWHVVRGCYERWHQNLLFYNNFEHLYESVGFRF